MFWFGAQFHFWVRACRPQNCNKSQSSRGISVLAHPSRRGAWRLFEPEWAQYLDGIELWNRKTDGWAPSRHAPLLLKRYSAHPFVGMDLHDRRQLFPLGMRIMTSEAVTEESMLANVKAGTSTHRSPMVSSSTSSFGAERILFCQPQKLAGALQLGRIDG